MSSLNAAPALYAILILSTFVAPATGYERKNITRLLDPVVIHGDVIRPFWGYKIAQLRLYAFRDSRWHAIPYQIDKVNSDGSYAIDLDSFPDSSVNEALVEEFLQEERDKLRIGNHVKEPHSDPSSSGDIDVIDNNDELSFMIRDAGDRAPSSNWLVKSTIEIELVDPVDDTKAWVYFLHFLDDVPAQSPKDYIHYDPVNDTIVSERVEFDFNSEKPLILDRIVGKPPNMDPLPDILDRFKLRIIVRPRILFCLRLHFDENNTRSVVAGYKDGPIRIIRRNLFWIVIGGVKLPFTPKMIAYIKAYEHGMAINTEYHIPVDMKWFLCKGSSFMAGLDLLKSSYGAKLFSKDNAPGTIIIDGTTSDAERQLVSYDQSWVAGYLSNGAALVSRMSYDEKMIELGATLDLHLTDNATLDDGPEDEPGQHFIGHTLDLERFPEGKYHMAFGFYTAYDFSPAEINQILHIDNQPLIARRSPPKP